MKILYFVVIVFFPFFLGAQQTAMYEVLQTVNFRSEPSTSTGKILQKLNVGTKISATETIETNHGTMLWAKSKLTWRADARQ